MSAAQDKSQDQVYPSHVHKRQNSGTHRTIGAFSLISIQRCPEYVIFCPIISRTDFKQCASGSCYGKKPMSSPLIRSHYENNEAAFRHQSIEIAREFENDGSESLADYVMALLNNSNAFVPQSLGGGSEFLIPLETTPSDDREKTLLLPRGCRTCYRRHCRRRQSRSRRKQVSFLRASSGNG